MSKHWNPGKQTVALEAAPRPSRIRRQPVALNPNVPAKPQRPVNIRERELYLGIAGIVVFAVAMGAIVILIAKYTVFNDDPAADARYAQFNQCYAATGPNCVADGGTIYVNNARVAIAGIEAPKIIDATCDKEHDRGVEAATQLAMILNSGPVSVGAPFRDESGRIVRKVQVKGRDVALSMLNRDLVHEANSGLAWCK